MPCTEMHVHVCVMSLGVPGDSHSSKMRFCEKFTFLFSRSFPFTYCWPSSTKPVSSKTKGEEKGSEGVRSPLVFELLDLSNFAGWARGRGPSGSPRRAAAAPPAPAPPGGPCQRRRAPSPEPEPRARAAARAPRSPPYITRRRAGPNRAEAAVPGAGSLRAGRRGGPAEGEAGAGRAERSSPAGPARGLPAEGAAAVSGERACGAARTPGGSGGRGSVGLPGRP